MSTGRSEERKANPGQRELAHRTSALTATVMAVAIVGMLYWAREVLIPLALAILLTFILSPGVTRLRRIGVGRVTAVMAVVICSLAIVIGITGLISWQVGALVKELPDHRERIGGKLESVRKWIDGEADGRFSALARDIEHALSREQPGDQPRAVPVEIVSQPSGWADRIRSWIGPAAETLARAVLTIVLVGFMLLNKEDLRNRMLRLIGPRRLTAATRAVDDAGLRVSRYLRIQLLINAAFGVILALTLLALGVRYAILWGFAAAILRYIPYIGAWLGLIPPLVAAIAMSDGVFQPVGVLTCYAVFELVVSQILEPHLFGHSLGLSEVAQIVSAACWAFLWGPIGLILSGPMTACLLVLGKNVPQLRCLDVLLGDEAALTPPMTLFQRLAARDRDEIWHIVTTYGATHTPEQVVDDLILPALALSHEAADRGELSEDEVDWLTGTLREILEDENLPAATVEAAEPALEPAPLLLAPAGSVGDSLALEVLERRLNGGDWKIHRLSDEALASDVVAAVRQSKPVAVVVGTLAGGELTQVRYLCKRLRIADPEIRIFVGRWGRGPVSNDLRKSLAEVGVEDSVGDIAGMLGLLKSRRSLLATVNDPMPSRPKSPRIGTASASARV